MPTANRVLLISLLLLSASCKHIGLLFEPPATLKAVVQGVVKGVNIHCEKTLSLGHGKWEVMCRVSDDIDIKYRTQSMESHQTKLEIIVDKKKGEGRKIIAAPTLVLQKGKPSALTTIVANSYIDITTDAIQ